MKTKITAVAIVMAVFLFTISTLEARESKKKVSGQLNLNTASTQQLDQLPGVSPKKAQAIVDYRKDHPFKSIDELDEVKGFSPKSIEKIKPYLTLDGSNSLTVEKGSSRKGRKEASSQAKQKSKKG